MNDVPILMNHDPDKHIGFLREEDGRLFVEFAQDVEITREWAFNIFGHAGLRVLEMSNRDGVFFIKKAEIIEFSLCPGPVFCTAPDSKSKND